MNYLQDNLVNYLRDQLIAALTHWLQAQAWNVFEILGWGGIAALIAGFFLIAALFTRLSKTLARPVPMVVTFCVIGLGAFFMVRGWMKAPTHRAALASTAPARKLPVVVPPLALATPGELASIETPPPVPFTVIPLNPVPPVVSLPSAPLHHHDAAPSHHATQHATAAHASSPMTRLPAVQHPASLAHASHSPAAPITAGAVHLAGAASPAASTAARTLAAPLSASAPAHPARPSDAAALEAAAASARSTKPTTPSKPAARGKPAKQPTTSPRVARSGGGTVSPNFAGGGQMGSSAPSGGALRCGTASREATAGRGYAVGMGGDHE